jgi:hypothetical protein
VIDTTTETPREESHFCGELSTAEQDESILNLINEAYGYKVLPV